MNPVILHHKYSLEDGHVAAQICRVEGYKGIMLTKDAISKQTEIPFASVASPSEESDRLKLLNVSDAAPATSIVSLEDIKREPGLLKHLHISGVHIHHGSLAPKFLFLKEKHDIPLFVSFRGKDATVYPKKKQGRAELKQLFQTGDLFFPVCNHLKKMIVKLGCPEEKVRVLYGGVDLERFQDRPRQWEPGKKIRFLAIGRFVEKKGFADLIYAFAVVKKRIPLVKLTLIGQGPCEAEYRKLIRLYGLGRSVQIIPWVSYHDIQKKYYQSHIFCAPSCTDKEGNQEGIPNTVKEAMATGMPVISTTHAGIPELVKHKVSGLLVPEKSRAELAKAMIWLAGHPEAWKSYGLEARKKVEADFNLSRQLEKQKSFYDEVIIRNASHR
ncbi:glycosyltransferase [Paenibacillus allorhizosphaerae]|uniref:D-inositol-3-phosphate glycosyltransferase n=1 Tax=Paenibacillus allorhizosphaerae TaxID=2849866 RepID=A0ABN7TSP6_9BACL|nr:glycosyltransferase [Paenibacillus allorhizosphaerae]CAG7647751.1 D-inositol-3-phosphate glycosyltransferase [Paenibacillus allorhizosphaerae]